MLVLLPLQLFFSRGLSYTAHVLCLCWCFADGSMGFIMVVTKFECQMLLATLQQMIRILHIRLSTCLVMRLTWKFTIFYQKGCVGHRQRWLLCGGMCFNDFVFSHFLWQQQCREHVLRHLRFSIRFSFSFWHLLHFIVITFIFILCSPCSFANQIALLFSFANFNAC